MTLSDFNFKDKSDSDCLVENGLKEGHNDCQEVIQKTNDTSLSERCHLISGDRLVAKECQIKENVK